MTHTTSGGIYNFLCMIFPEYGELVCLPRESGDFTGKELQELLTVSPVRKDATGAKVYYGPLED